MFSNILVAVDGRLHTERAMEAALSMALSFSAKVTALHVVDPYLKQFYNDIYAQGRQEYLDHVDETLLQESIQVERRVREFFASCSDSFSFIRKAGDPLDVIIEEAQDGGHDLLIMGGKVLHRRGLNRIRSWNLPSKIEGMGLEIPILIVRSRLQDAPPR